MTRGVAPQAMHRAAAPSRWSTARRTATSPPPDVQKIAEAFLLWNGNHTWKVVDVAPTSDGAIGFALATPGRLGDRPLHHGPAYRPGDPHRLSAIKPRV